MIAVLPPHDVKQSARFEKELIPLQIIQELKAQLLADTNDQTVRSECQCHLARLSSIIDSLDSSQMQNNPELYLHGLISRAIVNQAQPYKRIGRMCLFRLVHKFFKRIYSDTPNKSFLFCKIIQAHCVSSPRIVLEDQVILDSNHSLTKICDEGQPHFINVTIVIGGYLQDQSQTAWQQIHLKAQTAFQLKWPSGSRRELMVDLAETGLCLASAFVGTPLTKLILLANSLRKFRRDNHFNNTFKQAVETGEVLGDFIANRLQGKQINIVSFSTGSEVAVQTLRRLNLLDKSSVIERIVFIGGAADPHTLRKTLQGVSQHRLHITNFFSSHDPMLTYVLKALRGNTGIGTSKIISNGHFVQNFDMSKSISGNWLQAGSLEAINRLAMLNSL